MAWLNTLLPAVAVVCLSVGWLLLLRFEVNKAINIVFGGCAHTDFSFAARRRNTQQFNSDDDDDDGIVSEKRHKSLRVDRFLSLSLSSPPLLLWLLCDSAQSRRSTHSIWRRLETKSIWVYISLHTCVHVFNEEADCISK